MKRDHIIRSVETSISSTQDEQAAARPPEWHVPEGWPETSGHRIYKAAWYIVSCVLLFAIVLALFSIGWEYSTRRYLKGFSDAIVPAAAPPEQKIESILNWMGHGPSRQAAGPDGLSPDRDPTETLNYQALLRVCGTATNAFINLADSSGLKARRLLLLDSRHLVKHVTAEVNVDGRWIVVDPAFRAILHGADGQLLTREQLTDPATLAAATKNIPGYDSSYTFESTAHIRLGRVHILGLPLRTIVDRFLPRSEGSVLVSLLVERESLAMMVASICLVVFLILLRFAMRWYGERRLGLLTPRVHIQIRRALVALLNTEG